MTENGGRVTISHVMQSGRARASDWCGVDWVATGAMVLHILLSFERLLVEVWVWNGMAWHSMAWHGMGRSRWVHDLRSGHMAMMLA